MLLIGDVIANAARVAPHAPAATLGDEAIDFGELDARANRVANGLSGLGITRGDRVLWWSDTDLAAVPLFVGLARLGAVFAPINARSPVDELQPVVDYARPRLLLTGPSHDDRADAFGIDFARGLPLGAAGAPAGSGPEESDSHVIFFTSGSTGRPKGVVLSHRANWLRTYAGATTTSGGGGVVCMFPMFHMAAWTIALGAWQARRAVHFVATPDAPSLLGACASHRAARLYCIPAVRARILDHGVARFDLTALEEADTGTSATPPELLASMKDALPWTATRVFYGSTEAGPSVQLGDRDLFRKPGSVGIAQPGVELRLTDDGEVCLRSPFLMDGYFDAPEETAAVLRDGWYHSGDLGALDDEGYLSIVGRARDVIRSGGETIAPAEVEAVVARHPAIAELAVVGLPDPRWGETVVAVVVARPGQEAPTVDELRAWLADRLAAAKHPRRVVAVAALPRTAATGQVQRTLLVERLQAGV